MVINNLIAQTFCRKHYLERKIGVYKLCYRQLTCSTIRRIIIININYFFMSNSISRVLFYVIINKIIVFKYILS